MNCKNAAIIFLLFLIFSFIVVFVPYITALDIEGIKYIQSLMSEIDSSIPILAGGALFHIMTILPLVIGCLYLLLKKEYRNMFLFAAVPFVAYFVNSIIKEIVQRPRPPIELQIQEHMSSSSYVSRHTFVTACLWGIFIYIFCKYCKNRIIKFFFIIVSSVWILFEGYSRIWLGVHNPTDVIGAIILACAFIIVYIRLIQKLNKEEKNS